MTWGDVCDNIVQTGKGKSNMLVSLFFRIGSHKGEANYAKKISQKMLDAVDQLPIGLGGLWTVSHYEGGDSQQRFIESSPLWAQGGSHAAPRRGIQKQRAKCRNKFASKHDQFANFFKPKLVTEHMTPDEEAHHLTDDAHEVPPAKLDTAALKARKYANINNFPALIMCYFNKQT